jgi:Holliday junction DNA helicase RuvA
MIAWVQGTLMERDTDSVVLNVGGVGYRLFVTNQTLSELPEKGQTVELLAHMIVREDAIQLYGFSSEDERQAFISLLGVTGIGPRLARAILSGIRPGELAGAVLRGESDRLQLIPGVGRRMAQRIVVELKGKVERFQPGALTLGEGQAPAVVEGESLFGDVLSALTNLGYRPSEARRAVARARDALQGTPTVQSWVKEALRILSP